MAILNNGDSGATARSIINAKADLASPTFTGTPTAPNPSVTVDNTQIATTAYVKDVILFVTPEMYGAVGDGATNDQAALAAAMASGSAVYLGKKNYRTNTTINAPAGSVMFSDGGIISTTSNIGIITVTGDDVTIKGVSFLGNSTGAGQLGINVTGFFHTQITNCNFTNLTYAGVYSVSAVGAREGSVYVTGGIADNCGVGYYMYTQTEYNKVCNVTAVNCTVAGVAFKGGNNQLIGSTLTNNAIGFSLITGANDGHGVASGNIINHNTINVQAVGILNGFLFVANEMYAGNITVTTSNGIIFQDNQIGGTPYTITQTNNTLTKWDNNTFVTDYTFTTTGTGQTYFNNHFETGTIPSGVINSVTGKLDLTANLPLGLTTAGTYTTTANDQASVDFTGTVTTRATASDTFGFVRIKPTTVAGAASQTLYALNVDASSMGTGNSPTKYAIYALGGINILNTAGAVSPFTLNVTSQNTGTIVNVNSSATSIFSINNSSGSSTVTINGVTATPANALAVIGTFTATTSSAILALNCTTTATAASDVLRVLRGFNTWNINSRATVTTYFAHYNPTISITSGSATHYSFVADETLSSALFRGGVNSGATPTAQWQLGAGTATANTAPLKFTSGTNLTTAETGAVEYDGTNLFFTRTGTTRETIICSNAVNSVSPTAPNRTITVVIAGTTYYLHAKTTND